MQSIPLGPLALPLNPLLLLGGWWLACVIAERLAGPERAKAGHILTQAAIAGLLTARLAFVTLAGGAYLASPLSVLDVRDGGFLPWPGFAAAVLLVALQAWRRPTLRRALAAGSAAGLVVWGGLSTALGVHDDNSALPALPLVDLQGRRVELHDRSDARPMVVNLWATWCAPCRAEMPMLADAAQRERDVRFVFVNHGERAEVVRAFLASQSYRLDGVLLDERMQVGAATHTAGLPTTLFLDARGGLVARHMGPLNAAALAARMQALKAP